MKTLNRLNYRSGRWLPFGATNAPYIAKEDIGHRVNSKHYDFFFKYFFFKHLPSQLPRVPAL